MKIARLLNRLILPLPTLEQVKIKNRCPVLHFFSFVKNFLF
jgi:hypothetical protein